MGKRRENRDREGSEVREIGRGIGERAIGINIGERDRRERQRERERERSGQTVIIDPSGPLTLGTVSHAWGRERERERDVW